MKKRAEQTANREAEAKNESFEPIDESGEAKARREVESAHRKLKRPIPHYKGLVPEVIAGLAHKELALNTLDRGVRRLRGSMSSRELRNQNNESFEDKLKFAHIVKRLSKSALAARAARIMARNEEFDGIAEEADETPKPKRVRKPKAAAPAPAPAKVTSKRVVVKPKAAATNSTVKSKRVSPFENLFTGKGHKLSNKTLALKKQYDQHRKKGHDEETATDMVYAGVKAEGDKKKAIRNRILNTLNTPGESSTIQLARGLGKAVNRVGRGVNTVARGAGRVVNTLTDRQLLPTLGKSLARRAGRGVGNVSRAAMRSKVGKVVTAAATEYSRVRAANESTEVNELNSTLGKLQAARKRRKTARLALNNSVIVDQTNLVNEAKPSEAVRRAIVNARKESLKHKLGKFLHGKTRVAKAAAKGQTKES
jgi:hypothetical protein